MNMGDYIREIESDVKYAAEGVMASVELKRKALARLNHSALPRAEKMHLRQKFEAMYRETLGIRSEEDL